MPSAAAEAARKSRAKDYASRQHRVMVERTKARLAAGEVLQCADPAPGCRRLIVQGLPFDIAHDHHDRTRLLGPACRRCNRWWAAFLTNSRRRARGPRPGRRQPRIGVLGPL